MENEMETDIIYRGYLITHTKTEIKENERLVTLETTVARTPRFDSIQGTYDFIDSKFTATHKSYDEALELLKGQLDQLPEKK